jgi:hypothetical protein
VEGSVSTPRFHFDGSRVLSLKSSLKTTVDWARAPTREISAAQARINGRTTIQLERVGRNLRRDIRYSLTLRRQEGLTVRLKHDGFVSSVN